MPLSAKSRWFTPALLSLEGRVYNRCPSRCFGRVRRLPIREESYEAGMLVLAGTGQRALLFVRAVGKRITGKVHREIIGIDSSNQSSKWDVAGLTSVLCVGRHPFVDQHLAWRAILTGH